MAEQIPPPQGASGPASFRSHDWHPYDSYLSIHHNYIERLTAEGAILRNSLSFYEIEDESRLLAVNLRGYIACSDNVAIRVDKWLDVRRRGRRVEVKGSDYVYHAWLRRERRNIIRYCTAHGLDDLHVHYYDLRSGIETQQPRIRLEELPTLGDFVRYAIILGRTAAG